VLRDFANLQGQVVIVGIGEGMEIWNVDDFETALAGEEEEFRQALDSE
jgi:DNA-binding transcriptional regulator/RsmH inhibitor MraZ